MDNINELKCILNENLNLNKERTSCLVRMLVALLITRTINLKKIACAMDSDAKYSSRYRRAQRFFSSFEMNFDLIAKFIFRIFFSECKAYHLTMDRTNWLWGKLNINILTLALVYKGTAIPIYWTLLNKKGNSNTQERIRIVQKFINTFGLKCIDNLLADREFIGEEWFKWLNKNGINFCIRIKKDTQTTNSRGQKVEVKTLFRGLQAGETRSLFGEREITGTRIYLEGKWMPGGQFLIVASNVMPGNLIKLYACRWEIETLFSCLKTKGFNFEDTHITDQERIKKLFFLLSVAFCWAHKTGEWQSEYNPILIKKHGRPKISLFRKGLDFLNETILKMHVKVELFKS